MTDFFGVTDNVEQLASVSNDGNVVYFTRSAQKYGDFVALAVSTKRSPLVTIKGRVLCSVTIRGGQEMYPIFRKTAGANLMLTVQANVLTVLNMKTAQVVVELKIDDKRSVEWSENGTRLFYVQDGKLFYYSFVTHRSTHINKEDMTYKQYMTNEDGTVLVFIHVESTVYYEHVWDVDGNRLLRMERMDGDDGKIPKKIYMTCKYSQVVYVYDDYVMVRRRGGDTTRIEQNAVLPVNTGVSMNLRRNNIMVYDHFYVYEYEHSPAYGKYTYAKEVRRLNDNGLVYRVENMPGSLFLCKNEQFMFIYVDNKISKAPLPHEPLFALFGRPRAPGSRLPTRDVVGSPEFDPILQRLVSYLGHS